MANTHEASLQAWTIHALKDACVQQQKKMRIEVPANRVQNPLDENSRPYDVGILLDQTYLIGMEFKVLEKDELISWKMSQHLLYMTLTDKRLPLFYVYNTQLLAELSSLYEDSEFRKVLEGSNISTPSQLPGKKPLIKNHSTLFEWWGKLLKNPNATDGGVPLSVAINDPSLFNEFSGDFPDIIWLLVIAKGDLRATWAMTHGELRNEISTLKAAWRKKDLKKLQKTDLPKRFQEAIQEIDDAVQNLRQDIESIQQSESDMNDKPDYDVLKP